jgi:DNA-binding NtrC family response regulator
VNHFLDELARRLDRPKMPIAPDALARLARHPWPGNVRELRNVVEQAAVLAASDAIQEADLRLPAETAGDATPRAEGDTSSEQKRSFSAAKREAVVDFERGYLLAALRANGGNVSRTAAAIGMVRQSLQQKIRELGLRADLELEGLRDADDE